MYVTLMPGDARSTVWQWQFVMTRGEDAATKLR